MVTTEIDQFKAKEKPIWFIIAIFIFVLLTFFYYSSLMLEPWHVLSLFGGDGGKNSYAYLYHIFYEKGFWSYCMNYPYGENIMFIDGQAALSVPLSYMKGISIEATLTVMWWSIGLSYILSMIFIYKILCHYEVKPLLAIIFGALITLFSPQFSRIGCHFGLSYVCVIPMLFYWTIIYHEKKSWLYVAYIAILGLIVSFLHFYFTALILIWISAYTVGYLVFTKGKFLLKIKHSLPYLGGLVAMLLVVNLVLILTDPYNDRPIAPYGFLSYITLPKHIFLSFYSPIWQYFDSNHKLKLEALTGEGECYLGLVVCLVFLITFFLFLFKLVRRPKKLLHDDRRVVFEGLWIFMAIGTLLLSMGVPFVFNLEWLVEFMAFMKQFRTLGRFSWIFYYIITIFSVIKLCSWYQNWSNKKLKIIPSIIVCCAIMVWSFELTGYYKAQKEFFKDARHNYDVVFGKKEHDWKKFLAEKNHNPSEFQALLVLKALFTGSEKLWVSGFHETCVFAAAMEIGMQMHIPLIDAYMGRSSWSIAEEQVKIAAGPYVYKPMLDRLPNNKPFLLLNEDGDVLDEDQAYILKASESLGKYLNWNVYVCYPDRIKANDLKNSVMMDSIVKSIPVGDTCLISGGGSWYVNHFDFGQAVTAFFGKGALLPIHCHDSDILEIPVTPAFDNQPYEFSCWFLTERQNHLSPDCLLNLFDANGNFMYYTGIRTCESTDNKDLLWFRCQGYINLPINCRKIKLKLIAQVKQGCYRVMDELMLRPAGSVIISKATDGKIMVNNHLFNGKLNYK